MRGLALALLLVAAACAPAPEAHPACRIGPDDGPPLASGDRGIGGTGRPAALAGGDRGIGGTGVIGVVTGFASICVNGVAVEHDMAAAAMDGGFGPAVPLRAGQVVVIRAAGEGAVLRADSVARRIEVLGPVTGTRPGGLVVAGQPIAFAPALRGGRNWEAGAWIAVSGLPRPDGVIEATRIDPAAPGRALLRGVVERDQAGLRLGAVRLAAGGAGGLVLGIPVIATGAWRDGALVLDGAEPDLTLADPSRRFGAETRRLLVEAFVGGGAGGWRLGPAGQVVVVDARLAGLPPPAEARRLVVEATRQPDGRFLAIAAAPPPAMSDGNGSPAGPGGPGTMGGPPGPGPAPGAAPGSGPGGGGPGGGPGGGGHGGGPGGGGHGGGPGGGGPGGGGQGGGGGGPGGR